MSNTAKGVFAEIQFLEPWGRGVSEGLEGRSFPGYPEAEMWVIEQANLFRGRLVMDVRITATGSGRTA